MVVYIYALIDPFTNEIRYVGKSVRPKERLQNECNEHSNTYRCHWIQSVIQKGSKPIQIILETVDEHTSWQDREKYWIAYGREKGWPLTNGTDGGDGVVNLSPESKERIRKAWIGRKHSVETRLKISEKLKGRKHTEEYKQYMHEVMLNREFSKETRDKLSKANSKLTRDDADVIRFRLKWGATQSKLAKEYGVNKGTISNIKRNKCYRIELKDMILPSWLVGKCG